jgi:hypothetical protein
MVENGPERNEDKIAPSLRILWRNRPAIISGRITLQSLHAPSHSPTFFGLPLGFNLLNTSSTSCSARSEIPVARRARELYFLQR